MPPGASARRLFYARFSPQPHPNRRHHHEWKGRHGERRPKRKGPTMSASTAKDFPIVCVGGSAGGLDAYIRLLSHLPADMGVAIVIVNHLRTVATLLHEILPHYTTMPVELITERLEIKP